MIGHPFLIKTLCFFLKMNGRFAISDNGCTDSGLPVGSFTNFKSPSTYLHGVNSEKSVTSPSKVHSKSRVSQSNSNGMNTSGLLNTSTSKLLQLCWNRGFPLMLTAIVLSLVGSATSISANLGFCRI